MTLREHIISFDYANIIDQLSSKKPEKVFQTFTAFAERILSISDIKIDELDRKILYVWKRQGLLPYQKRGKNEKRIWGKFSFIEACWLKFLFELRSVGIGIKMIQEVTNELHKTSFIHMLISNYETISAESDLEILEKLKVNGLTPDKDFKIDEDFELWLDEIQLSHFSLLIYETIINKRNYAIYFDGEKKYNLIDIDKMWENPKNGIAQFNELINSSSLVFINITKIITDISNTHDLFSKNKY
jgi:hypothetical protein